MSQPISTEAVAAIKEAQTALEMSFNWVAKPEKRALLADTVAEVKKTLDPYFHEFDEWSRREEFIGQATLVQMMANDEETETAELREEMGKLTSDLFGSLYRIYMVHNLD
jgi:hypothetical protein